MRCLGEREAVLIDWIDASIVSQGDGEHRMGGRVLTSLIALLPLLLATLLEVSRSGELLLLLLRATPLPPWVANAVLGGARVLGQV